MDEGVIVDQEWFSFCTVVVKLPLRRTTGNLKVLRYRNYIDERREQIINETFNSEMGRFRQNLQKYSRDLLHFGILGLLDCTLFIIVGYQGGIIDEERLSKTFVRKSVHWASCVIVSHVTHCSTTFIKMACITSSTVFTICREVSIF